MSTVKLAGLDWTESYNCYRTVVNGWLELAFHYENGLYFPSINDRQIKLKIKLESPEIAAHALRIFAVTRLRNALIQLEEK